MRTYFKQTDKQRNRLALQVHLQAAVELLLDVLHVLGVARLPKHPLGGRPCFPQQHQHLLVREEGARGEIIRVKAETACASEINQHAAHAAHKWFPVLSKVN